MASRSRRSAVVTAYFFGKSIADLAFPAATAESPHLTRWVGVVTASVTPRGLQFVRMGTSGLSALYAMVLRGLRQCPASCRRE